MIKKILLAAVLPGLFTAPAEAGYSTHNAHSHNDYKNQVPFRPAYDAHFGSIEADIWAVNGELFVAHDEADIRPERSLDALYIEPIVRLFRENGEKAWKNDPASFQLVIDLKTPTEPALSLLVDKLNRFPDVFDRKTNRNAVRVIITGNGPKPSGFGKYTGIVSFDGVPGVKYDKDQLGRIALVSGDFKKLSSWNGKGDMAANERLALQEAIDAVHSQKKKIRFWNAPDNPAAWNFFMKAGADFINTDHVEELADYLNKQRSSPAK